MANSKIQSLDIKNVLDSSDVILIASANYATYLISGVTQSNPVVITSVGHGLVNGNEVYIHAVGGMTQLNGNTYVVANVTADTFELQGIDGTGFNAYTNGGTVIRGRLQVTTLGDLLRHPSTRLKVLSAGNFDTFVEFSDMTGLFQGDIRPKGGAGSLTARGLEISLPNPTGSGGVSDSWFDFRFGSGNNKLFIGDTGSITWIQAGFQHPLYFGVGSAINRTDLAPALVLQISGNLSSGTTLDLLARLGIVIPAATTKGQVIRKHASQTANLLELQDSAGAVQLAIGAGMTIHFGTETDNGNSGTAKTINWANKNKQKLTLTGNCNLTFNSPGGCCNLTLRLIQDATGSRTVVWPATVKWAGGVVPILTTSPGAIDIVSMYFDGANYFASAGLNFG